MKLNPPKKNLFWASVILAVLGMLSYAYHLITLYVFRAYQPHFQMIAFVLVSAGFVLLILGLTIKDL
jgi:peptidoglycan/LPS O-acetylase OafA/YrhL